MTKYLLVPIFIFNLFFFCKAAAQNDSTSLVMVMKIDKEINPSMNRYTKLALEKTDESGADIVIIEMNTYGGTLKDADEIRTRILQFDKPVWVFINKNAASAGALISISCDSIYMAPGASIGAATVVVQTGEAAPDKYQSYMRSMMRSTAEANGRDPRIAEGMVDQKLKVDSISEAGQVITFSTSEAIKYGYCEGKVSSIEAILAKNGIRHYKIENFQLPGAEEVIRVFMNPVISGILILIILGGIYFELQTPGVGFPLAASIAAAVLYFIPYYLNGLAANWEIIIFLVGLILLALEFFVIPGFGIAGISGITLTLGSLILVMLDNNYFDFSFVRPRDIFRAVATIMGGFSASLLLMFFGGLHLTRTRMFRKVALNDTQESSRGYVTRFRDDTLIGKTGVAYSVLRPSGKVMIEGNIYDAYTRGEYIKKDEKVIVISEEGTTLRVRLQT